MPADNNAICKCVTRHPLCVPRAHYLWLRDGGRRISWTQLAAPHAAFKSRPHQLQLRTVVSGDERKTNREAPL